MAEALLISRRLYAGAIALGVIALPVVAFALLRVWRERSGSRRG
jgi:hypothetical protein